MKSISPRELKAALQSPGEIALVDVREEQDFHDGHLLVAVNIPLSRLEQLVGDQVPRKGARIVLCDGGPPSQLAQRAAGRLAWLGYSDVAVLHGGTSGWQQDGGLVFSGTNLPSKAFGEFVEHTYGTPNIGPRELKQKIDAREDMVILDSRPQEEFRIMSIPQGIDCPGAELVYRAREAAPSPETLIVVNCAGRTRSIIGAQSLRNAGVPNRVVALRDGTMGWQLAGFAVAEGAQAFAPRPSPSTVQQAREAALDVARRAGVRFIDTAQLDRFRLERETRTLYVLDVRTPREYEEGHLRDAVHAFGGQLVQNTDKFVAVRGARLVLVDDTLARAAMTASWLRQMGWDEVYVLEGGVASQPLVSGKRRQPIFGVDQCDTPLVDAASLNDLLRTGEAAVVDLADARKYKAAHIPGAWYAVRSSLPSGLERFKGQRVIFTSSDGRFARLAAHEFRDVLPGAASLEGGTAAWTDAGFALESGEDRLLHPRIESWSPYDPQNRTEQVMRDYLAWEVALYDRAQQDGTLNFRKLPPSTRTAA